TSTTRSGRTTKAGRKRGRRAKRARTTRTTRTPRTTTSGRTTRSGRTTTSTRRTTRTSRRRSPRSRRSPLQGGQHLLRVARGLHRVPHLRDAALLVDEHRDARDAHVLPPVVRLLPPRAERLAERAVIG